MEPFSIARAICGFVRSLRRPSRRCSVHFLFVCFAIASLYRSPDTLSVCKLVLLLQVRKLRLEIVGEANDLSILVHSPENVHENE